MSLMSVLSCISEAAGPGKVQTLKQIHVFPAHVGWVVTITSLMVEAVLLHVAELHICLRSGGVLMRDHVQR